MKSLTAYIIDGHDVRIRPAPVERDWMDGKSSVGLKSDIFGSLEAYLSLVPSVGGTEMDNLTPAEFQMLSQAVVLWYRYYGIRPAVGRSDALCREAVALFEEGLTTSKDIAAILIEKYSADESHLSLGSHQALKATPVNRPCPDYPRSKTRN